MKTAAIVAFLKALLEVLRLWRRHKDEAEVREEVQDDIRLVDQAEALHVERAAADVAPKLPADRIHERRGRRPTPGTPAGDN